MVKNCTCGKPVTHARRPSSGRGRPPKLCGRCAVKANRASNRERARKRDYSLRSRAWIHSTANNLRTRALAAGQGYDVDAVVKLLQSAPDVCPVLGIPLKTRQGQRGPADDSPSIDRHDNSKGYVAGNMAVISGRANRLKSDGTPDELMRVALYAAGKL